MASFNQSECIISAKCKYPLLKIVYEIDSIFGISVEFRLYAKDNNFFSIMHCDCTQNNNLSRMLSNVVNSCKSADDVA